MRKSILLFFSVIFIISAVCPFASADTVQTITAPGTLTADIMQSYIQISIADAAPSGQSTVLEKSTDSGDFYVIQILSSGIKSYTDYGISNGHVYKYRAKRTSNQNFSAYSNEVEAVWLYPTGLNITNAYADQIDLSWSYPQLTVSRDVDYQTVIERRLENESSWTVVYTAQFSEQEYRDSNLKPDSVYYYRIRTKYPNGQYSNYAPSATGINRRTTISLTTPLTGFALTDTQISLDWDASALNGTTAILEKMDSIGNFVEIHRDKTTDHYIDSGLTPKKEYYYRLCLRSDYGSVSNYTEVLAVQTETIPSPTEIKAIPISLGRIALSWSFPYDVESGFEVWRKEQGANWQLSATLSKNTTNYTDYTALPDKTYTYRVRAIRGDNVFSDFITSSTVNNANPAAPPPLVIIPMGYGLKVGTDYAPPQGITYTLEFRTDINDIWHDHSSTSNGKALLADFLTSGGKEYDLRLRSENQGNATYGPIYHIYAAKPEAPANLKVIAAGSNRVLLNWSDNTSKEDGYHIYRTYAGNRTLVGTTGKDESVFADDSVTPWTTVKYEVCAFNTRGESGVVSVSVNIPRRAAFKDISNIYWAVDAVNSLYSIGAVSPSSTGLFYPNRTITRAEFVTILFKSFDIVPDSGFLFSLKDVPTNSWYYSYVMTAVKDGIITANEDGKARPLDPVTKGDIAVCLDRIAALRNQPLNHYDASMLDKVPDGNLVSGDLQEIMASFVGDYVMPAQNGKALNLSKPATRAEAAAIIYKFYMKYF